MAAAELASKRYAQAAFELAVEGKNAPEWERALDRIADFMSEPQVQGVLTNTRAALETKQQLIEAGLNDLPKLALNLAHLLVRKGRAGLAREVSDAFKELLEQSEGISRARAVTAVPLSDAEVATLTQRLEEQTGRRIILETSVDPALLGGVLVQIGDKQVDASTRARLAALRESLEGSLA